MKTFIKIACLCLFIAVIYYFFFADESSKSVTDDDRITLIFDQGYLNPSAVNKELTTLLIKAGMNLGDDNRYLISESSVFNNHILTFYLPKNSIRYKQKDYIADRLEIARKSYLAQKQKIAKGYELSFDLAIADDITPRDIGIEKFIDNEENLKRFKKDTAPYNQHFEGTVKLGQKKELASTLYGVSIEKICAVRLNGVPEVKYTKLNLNDYLTEKMRKELFRYSHNPSNENIPIAVELKNIAFKDNDSDFVKQLKSQPNKYQIIMVPIKQPSSPNYYNNRYAPPPPPTSAAIYLTYDTVKLKGTNQISRTEPCVWPADFVEPDPDDSNTPFAHLIGYQLDIGLQRPSSTNQ